MSSQETAVSTIQPMFLGIVLQVRTSCDHINDIWNSISALLVGSSSPDVTVDLSSFEMAEYKK